MKTEDRVLCDKQVCVNCGFCEACNRVVGTRHLDVCACPPEVKHYFCLACLAISHGRRDSR